MTAKRVDRGDDHRGDVRREGPGEDDRGDDPGEDDRRDDLGEDNLGEVRRY